MELCAQLERKRLDLDLRWRRREDNTEADALTNLNFSGFRQEHRVEVDFESLDFLYHRDLFAKGQEFFEELSATRLHRRAAGPEAPPRQRRRPEAKLKAREPW